MCPTCEAEAKKQDDAKLDRLKAKFRVEAAAKGLSAYYIVRTKNANPGFMWREEGHPDIDRLGLYEIGIVY